MKDWFLELEQRERILVSAGAVLLVLLTLYLMVWEPIADDYHGLQSNVAKQQETLAWMQKAAVQVKGLRRNNPAAAQGLGGRSMLAVVDKSARTGGLGAAIKRIEPDGSKGVKVWFEGVSFDAMVLWIGKLSKSYAIEVDSGTLEPLGRGRINARLTLLEPAA